MDIVAFVELTIAGDTYRFGYASELQFGYDHIPSLKSITMRPAILDPGESIGQRETVTIQFLDHLHRFDVDNFEDGTFWTKFRARYVTVEGATVRVIRGRVGQLIADMDTYLYIATTLQLSRTGATLQAKDPLTLLDSKAAQAPKISEGELDADILAADMAFTLAPAGIGDLQYPAAGKGVLGGKELIQFTRVADAVTIVQRGINVEPDDHDEGTKFQLVLEYVDKKPSELVSDLLLNYTDVDPAWITITDWQNGVDNFVDRVYSAMIASPTSVKKLLDELCVTIALIFYWDPFAEQIRLRPLLASATVGGIDENRIIEGSFSSVEQPEKRVSQIWTYYAQRDPVEDVDDDKNYQRVLVKIAPNAGDFPQQAIRKIHSRWIPFPARATAQFLNELMVARYQIPPRRFKLSLFKNKDDVPPPLAAIADLRHWFLVDGMGIQETVKSQAVSLIQSDAEVGYDFEELKFDEDVLAPEPNKFIFIEVDSYNVNLRDLFEQVYTEANDGDTVTFVVETGIRVGSRRSNGGPSIIVGDWPPEEGTVTLFLRLSAGSRVEGVGGDGGGAVDAGQSPNGHAGGTALFTRHPITVTNLGSIWGGGGGGGGGRIKRTLGLGPGGEPIIVFDGRSVGGAGAGFEPGLEGVSAVIENRFEATEFAGTAGDGLKHGHGGAPGQPGTGGTGYLGGAAGRAIDGVSFITFDGPAGDIIGPQVN